MTNAASPGLAWTDALAVHLSYLDNQHKDILTFINMWWEKIQSRQFAPTPKLMNRIFNYLNVFTQQHLELEERLIQHMGEAGLLSTGYIESHIAYHTAFRKTVMGNLQQAILNKDYLHDDPNAFLMPVAKWWVPHIRSEDLQYAAAIKSMSNGQRDAMHTAMVNSLLHDPIVVVPYIKHIKELTEARH